MFALGASAQEVQTSENVNSQAGKNTVFQLNSGDNWFISARGGLNYGKSFLSNKPQDVDFAKRLGYDAGLGFGKWYTPFFASRLMLDWGYARDPFRDIDKEGNLILVHTGNAHIDFMFDPANYFSAYNPNRTVRFVPYIGVGVMCARPAEVKTKNGEEIKFFSSEWLAMNNYAASGVLGFDLSFRLSKVVDLVIAPSVTFTNVFLPQERRGE